MFILLESMWLYVPYEHIISPLAFLKDATLSTLIASASISLYSLHAAENKNHFPKLAK